MRYRFFDWDGNKKSEKDCNLKDAVREALKLQCEIWDKNDDIVFSCWDGWNSDYPNIDKIYFPVADMEMVKKGMEFLERTGQFYEFCDLQAKQLYIWIGRQEWLRSDRWSAVYDWVNDGRFSDIDVPEDMVSCLTEYWEKSSGISIGI